MTRPDDGTLDPEDLRAVEEQAHRLLDRADAWDRYPVPVDDILSAAKVRLAPTSVFDPATIISYLRGKTTGARARIKSAITKVFGLYDAAEALIHIDDTVVESRQTFVTLHETGHHDIPTHRKMFRIFQDCEKTLSPDMPIDSNVKPTTLLASSCSRARPSPSMPRTARSRSRLR